MPAIVGRDGVECTVPYELSKKEVEALQESAKTLKEVIDDAL